MTGRKSGAAPAVSIGLLLLAAASAGAAGLDVRIDPGSFAGDTPPTRDNRLNTGLDIAVRAPLLDAVIDYDWQLEIDDPHEVTDYDPAQRLDAALNSRVLNELLGVDTRLHTHSTVWNFRDSYRHRFNPGFSRKLTDRTTLDFNYQVLLTKPAAQVDPRQQRSYSVALRGTMAAGRLQWNGTYSTDSTYQGASSPIQHRQSVRWQGSYRALPHMQLQLTGARTETTHVTGADTSEAEQTRIGAALRWRPASDYTVDLAVEGTLHTRTGAEQLSRRGRIVWLPYEALTVSLNYEDQLAGAGRGIRLDTRLDFGLF